MKIRNLDYELIPENDSSLTRIKLLSGDFKNVIYTYGKVDFIEHGDELRLQFDLNVIYSPFEKEKDLIRDENFKKEVGDLLIQIMQELFLGETLEYGYGISDIEEFD